MIRTAERAYAKKEGSLHYVYSISPMLLQLKRSVQSFRASSRGLGPAIGKNTNYKIKVFSFPCPGRWKILMVWVWANEDKNTLFLSYNKTPPWWGSVGLSIKKKADTSIGIANNVFYVLIKDTLNSSRTKLLLRSEEPVPALRSFVI